MEWKEDEGRRGRGGEKIEWRVKGMIKRKYGGKGKDEKSMKRAEKRRREEKE